MGEQSDILRVPMAELTRDRQPDFGQLLKVLRRETPDRPVLFELAANVSFAMALPGTEWLPDDEPFAAQRNFFRAYRLLGYDYANVPTWSYALQSGRFGAGGKKEGAKTVSQNEGFVITDEASFERFQWPELNPSEYERLGELKALVPEGMRLLLRSTVSIQEGLISLVGFENLCYMMYDKPDLVQAMADKLGEFAIRHFELGLQHDFVGVCLLSDDWGFKTQTLMPPDFLRRYVIPWHARAVKTVHAAGRPMILHSCGQIDAVMEDVIETCRYDAKHSFEDGITPVEEALDRWGGRIAILGGIDVDFLCRRSPGEVFDRSRALLARAAARRGYALGSGNSIPDYVPAENYFAMNKAALVGAA